LWKLVPHCPRCQERYETATEAERLQRVLQGSAQNGLGKSRVQFAQLGKANLKPGGGIAKPRNVPKVHMY
jgi:hypothetical protein